jgi:bacterioferritin (cytochrome b1)
MTIEIMNALLSAEYAAVQAYNAGAAVLMKPPPGDPLESAAPTVLAVAVHFQQQHRDHAEQLVARIMADGGTPVDESTITFTPPAGFTPSVMNVIRLAANAEKDAAVTYSQVLAEVDTATQATLVASIGGVEAQHYIVLSLVAQGVVQATPTTMAMAMQLTPTAFVLSPAAGVDGLMSVPDFTYEP